MPKEFNRVERVAELIQRELAQLIQREVKDPRLAGRMITVSAVEVSRDLAHAKVFVTVLGSAEQEQQEIEKIIEILNHAASYLRTKLGRTTKLRTTPQLHFSYDTSLEYGNRLSNLIDTMIEQDEKSRED